MLPKHDQIAIGAGRLDHGLHFAAVSRRKTLVEGLGGRIDERRDLVQALLLEIVLEVRDQGERRLQRQRADLRADLLRRADGRQNRNAVDVAQLALARSVLRDSETVRRQKRRAETEDREAEEQQRRIFMSRSTTFSSAGMGLDPGNAAGSFRSVRTSIRQLSPKSTSFRPPSAAARLPRDRKSSEKRRRRIPDRRRPWPPARRSPTNGTTTKNQFHSSPVTMPREANSENTPQSAA